MGDVIDDILSGLLCMKCEGYAGAPVGYTRLCAYCQGVYKTATKPHECDKCKKRFFNEYALAQHTKDKH